MINVIGVALNFYMSRMFLGKVIRNSELMQKHLLTIQDKVSLMGSDQKVSCMISLRMFPGSPNPLYNLLFPHIKAISLTQNLLGVLIGQLPYNLCVAKAG